MKKSYLALTLFVILSVLLTSCGGAAAPTTAPTTAPQATAAPATSAPSTPSKLDEIRVLFEVGAFDLLF